MFNYGYVQLYMNATVSPDSDSVFLGCHEKHWRCNSLFAVKWYETMYSTPYAATNCHSEE